MAERRNPAPPQLAPNVGHPTYVSGASVTSSNVPVAQLINLRDSVVQSPSSVRETSQSVASRRDSVRDGSLRSANPFFQPSVVDEWSKADAIFNATRDRFHGGSSPRSRVSFGPDRENVKVLSPWPSGQVTSTPFHRPSMHDDIEERSINRRNPFLSSSIPNTLWNADRVPKTEASADGVDYSRTLNAFPPFVPERKSAIKVDKYDGSTCVETFLLKFGHIAQYNRWQDNDKAAHLAAALTGSAGLILWNLADPTYDELAARLRQRYGSAEQREKFRHELRARRRKRDENLQELAQDVERLAALAYPDDPQATRDRLGVEAFIEALNDPELICKIREREPASLQSALSTATKLEILHRVRDAAGPRSARPVYDDGDHESIERSSKRKEGRVVAKNSEASTIAQRSECAAAVDAWTNGSGILTNELRKQLDVAIKQKGTAEAEVCRLKAEVDALKARSSAPSLPLAQPTYLPQFVSAAPAFPPTHAPVANGPTVQFATPPADYIQTGQPVRARPNGRGCFECGDYGHFRRECPRRASRPFQPSAASVNAPSAEPNISFQARCSVDTETRTLRRVYLTVVVKGRPFDCLLDTGCETSVIPLSMAADVCLEPVDRKLMAANGSEIPVKGVAHIEATIGRCSVRIAALVSEHVFDPMLGIDWLENNEAVWDFAKGRVRIAGKWFVLKSRPERVLWSRRVILAEDVVVPPSSEKVVFTYLQCRALDCFGESPNSTWLSEPRIAQPGVVSARAIVPNDVVDIPMRVINVNDQPVNLKRGSLIAELQEAAVVDTAVDRDEPNEGILPPELEHMADRVDPSVPASVVNGLRSLLTEYSGVFSTGPTDLGRTDLAVHSIDTGNAPPFRQPLRRHPFAYRNAIDEQLSELLNQGVIEPCQSPYASNLVLVRKKDGSLRCCVDYRQLNLQTKRDAYPLPRTDACLEAMNGAKFFSTFDMRSGYHQVCVDGNDMDKTAFICHRGQFRFRTMPFGLQNAGATFQRLMDLVLVGLTFEICLVYLDDIILFSSTPEQHLERLRTVLYRISKCGMKLKASKCVLMQKSVHFLGHVVSNEGIETDPEKIRLIVQWPKPSNLGELRSFLGLAGYYRRYVRDYSKIAAPLTELTKKSVRFSFDENCCRAFETLKTRLSTPPILAMPNDQDVYVLDTDASDRAIGAVLSQVQHGQEKVIAFAGRCLNRSETNYCVTRKELLAVVYFIRYFRHFLVGRPFKLRTDHSALTWLNKTRDPIGQNARWLEQLGEFDFEVQHRPGQSHGNADALSRRPCPVRSPCSACRPKEETEVKCRALINAQPTDFFDEPAGQSADWSVEKLVQTQASDLDLAPLVSIGFPLGERPPYSVVAHLSSASKSLWYQWERMYVSNGLIYRRWESPDGLSVHGQLYVPRCLREELLRLVHSGMTGGHLGRLKTEEQVARRAYWPSWTSDVRSYLKRCEPCAKYHRGKPPRQAKLNPFVAGEPFELISIDVTGPHPTSKRGNRFIVTVVDSFSKWAEAFPVRNHHADTIARLLVDRVFATFGAPKRILSDRGPEFESSLISSLCKLMQIEKIRTTAYKASTNGLVERFHSTLNSMIAKFVSEDQRDWDVHLSKIIAAYRASKHKSTGLTPNFIIFGRENRAPADLVLPSPSTANNPPAANTDEYTERTRERYTRAYDIVRGYLRKAAQRRKEYYDTKVKTAEFKPGELVWYYYPKRKKGRSPKWMSFYTGPYRIVRAIPPCNYSLQKGPRTKTFVVHADKLKRCHTDSTEQPPPGCSKQLPNATDKRATIPRDVVRESNNSLSELDRDSSDDYGSDDPPRRGERARRPRRPYSPT